MRSRLKALLETSIPEAVRLGATTDGQRPTIWVEFAPLSDEQQALVDLHTLRAVGSDVSAVETDGIVIEFSLRKGDTVDAAYDDIRGWAIGNGLPIRRMIDD